MVLGQTGAWLSGRDRTEVAHFYAIGRLTKADKTVRVKVGKHPHISATAARREALSLLADLSQGRDPRTQRYASLRDTLTAYCDYWSHAARDRLSEDTARQYRRALDLHCADWLDKPLDAITQHDVHRLHDRLGKKPYMANQVIRVLRQLYRFARRTDSTIEDPTSSVGFYREKERRSKLQLPDLPGWYQAVMQIGNPYRRNYHLIALMTGIRRENLAEMRWEHVDLNQGTIYLPRTKSRRTPTLPVSAFVLCSDPIELGYRPYFIRWWADMWHISVYCDDGSERLGDLDRPFIGAIAGRDPPHIDLRAPRILA